MQLKRPLPSVLFVALLIFNKIETALLSKAYLDLFPTFYSTIIVPSASMILITSLIFIVLSFLLFSLCKNTLTPDSISWRLQQSPPCQILLLHSLQNFGSNFFFLLQSVSCTNLICSSFLRPKWIFSSQGAQMVQDELQSS